MRTCTNSLAYNKNAKVINLGFLHNFLAKEHRDPKA